MLSQHQKLNVSELGCPEVHQGICSLEDNTGERTHMQILLDLRTQCHVGCYYPQITDLALD